MHPQAFEFVRRTRDLLGLDKPLEVVEIGSRNVNGSVRPLFAGAKNYVGLDLVEGPGVDWVGDFRQWPGIAAVADLVICTEVAEHDPGWREILSRAADVLRPGGVLIVTAAAPPRAPHSAFDGGPLREGEHYGNLDPHVLAIALGLRFRSWQVEYHGDRGDVYGLGVKE